MIEWLIERGISLRVQLAGDYIPADDIAAIRAIVDAGVHVQIESGSTYLLERTLDEIARPLVEAW